MGHWGGQGGKRCLLSSGHRGLDGLAAGVKFDFASWVHFHLILESKFLSNTQLTAKCTCA